MLAQLGRAGGLFTYRVPEDMSTSIRLGTLVRIPFTNRQFQGVVCALSPTCELPRLRDIAEVLDPTPVVTPYGLRLAGWIAQYYAAPISDVLAAMLPPGLGRQTIPIVEPAGEVDGRRLSASQQQVRDLVCSAGRIAVAALQATLPDVDVERAVASLARRGLLRRTAALAPPRVSSRTARVLAPTDAGLTALRTGEHLERAPRRRAVLQAIVERGESTPADLTETAGNVQSILPALLDLGLIRSEQREQARSPLNGRAYATTQPLPLGPAQRTALEHITHSVSARRPDLFLLHGVTGSGKTEVYLQAIAATIRQGRQAIVMVPEISLTPQAIQRVAGRFPSRVAVLHSRLSPGERVDEWQRIRRGDVDVVVGPRSALFAPLPRPGLLVVDEEHDPSYKQDSSPRYHARDAATVLGRSTGATVVFGSATPDVATYRAALDGRVTLLELPDRPVWGDDVAEARPMPPVEIVDMRQELKGGNRGIFSRALLEALSHTLDNGHQGLLFLNRRGSATVVLCRDCGYVARCPHCDVPYTYHASAIRLICHRCDRRVSSPRSCPACQSPRIRYLGVGTQRVEEEVARLFPAARVLRWDRDVTGGKEAHERIVRAFTAHEADILVGTQMIAKGLDFPLVTVVGVISADTGLHMPDFRAPERSFQLLTQVAGRAGRASLPSRVVVQTYTPDHYAIQAAQGHDYHRFFREEMSFRQSACYPPFARLLRLVYSAEREENCRQSAHNLRAILERAIGEEGVPGTELIGPAPCFVARVKNRYYWQVIIRAGRDGSRELHRLLDYVPAGWTVDVDPVDLL